VQLIVTPTFAEIQGRVPSQFLQALRETLRYREEGYQHTYLYKTQLRDLKILQNGEAAAITAGLPVPPELTQSIEAAKRKLAAVGWQYMIRQLKHTTVIPAGLVHRVLPVAEAAGLKVERTDIHLDRLETDHLACVLSDGTKLYPDQEEALRTVVKEQRGLLALAVNFGKTELAGAVAATYPGEKFLMLVNRDTLLHQTKDRLEKRLNRRVAWLGGGGFKEALAQAKRSAITVAMIQSLYKHKGQPELLKFLESVRILVVDEVHTVTPKMWFPILGACRAPMRIGMSGTVKEVHSPLPVEAFFGPVLMEVKETQLVEAGRSAEAIILMPNAGALVNDGLDYKVEYEEAIVNNTSRNELLVRAVQWAAHRGLRSLVLFYRLEHGAELQRRLERAGVASVCVHGKSPYQEIEEAKAALTARRLQAIVASTIFNTGVDLPAAEVLVNVAAWKSPLATAQKLGRILRRKLEGRNLALVIDPWDYGSRRLKRHSESREKLYDRRGFTVHRGTLEDLLAAGGPAEAMTS
jgi:superfamily II DNA or RNA helicase